MITPVSNLAQSDLAQDTRPRLIAIGNFDGVHRGHQQLLRDVVTSAQKSQLVPTVLTFDPHPSIVLGRKAQELLVTLPRKLELLAELSPELEVRVRAFDMTLASQSPREFAELLVSEYHAARVIVGGNFRFGKGRSGNLETLKALALELGFNADATELLTLGGEVISSSRIRQAITRGDLALGRELLGRPHALSGHVVRGAQRGRQLGFPTVNLEPVNELLPPYGVYACQVVLTNQSTANTLPAVANIGVRPTLDGSKTSVEAHLLDYSGDLYGEPVRLDLLSYVREERRFENLDALKTQIARDVEVARDRLQIENP